jgi:hypothetical protein
MTIESSLLEQAFVKEESPFGTLATPAAGDGFRHQELSLDKQLNRVPSPEKRGTPDRAQSRPGLPDTSFDLASGFWEPSGVLGTPSYMGPFLKNGFGAQHSLSLATTIASGAATTGATLASATGVQVGDSAIVTLASGARREITRIKSVAGAVVTWDTLSAVPDAPGAVVFGVSYSLASLVPTSLSIFKFHTAGGFKEAVSGAFVNKMAFMLDGSKDVQLKLSGPARNRVLTGFSQPGAFTTVGSPASGLVGNVYVGGTAFLVLSASIEVDNQSQIRRGEIGTGGLGTGIISHADFRNIQVTFSFYLEDTTLINQAEAVTTSTLRLLIGDTNGSMVGLVLPRVEFEIPKIPTSGGPKVVSITGQAYATNGNDALYGAEI